MIVNIRLDLNHEQRSELSLLLRPKALKRLATRKDVLDNLALTFEVISGQRRPCDWPEPNPDRPDYVPITNDMIDDVVKPGRMLSDPESQHSLDTLLLSTSPPDMVVSRNPLTCAGKTDEAIAKEPLKTGLRPAMLTINNIMFSLADAARQLDSPKYRELRDQVEALAHSMAVKHDEVYEDSRRGAQL